MSSRPFDLGILAALDGNGDRPRLPIPSHHFVTHGVVVGMTGSGKTGLSMVIVEEALRSQVPVIVIDVKGDLPNLMLTFPDESPARFLPWIDGLTAQRDGRAPEDLAAELSTERSNELAQWELSDAPRDLREHSVVRLFTPGATIGEPLDILSTLERASPLWQQDEEIARSTTSAALSLVLRLLDRDPDPATSREHAVLFVLAERRLRAGLACTLEALIADLTDPPIDEIGAMPLDEFLKRRERNALCAALNVLLASPAFASWRRGAALDVGAWLKPDDQGRTPASIVSIAHLDDDERMLVVGILLEEILAWVRTQPGTSALRALIVFDEVYGFVPPHPANPPSKRPLVSLLKQARAFGVGVVVATQNPMDIDYRALSNAGTWFVGRLQTDADRARVVEGLMGVDGSVGDPATLDATLKQLSPRWFVMRDVHTTWGPVLMHTRPTLSWMRGPMTRRELRQAHADITEETDGSKPIAHSPG